MYFVNNVQKERALILAYGLMLVGSIAYGMEEESVKKDEKRKSQLLRRLSFNSKNPLTILPVIKQQEDEIRKGAASNSHDKLMTYFGQKYLREDQSEIVKEQEELESDKEEKDPYPLLVIGSNKSPKTPKLRPDQLFINPDRKSSVIRSTEATHDRRTIAGMKSRSSYYLLKEKRKVGGLKRSLSENALSDTTTLIGHIGKLNSKKTIGNKKLKKITAELLEIQKLIKKGTISYDFAADKHKNSIIMFFMQKVEKLCLSEVIEDGNTVGLHMLLSSLFYEMLKINKRNEAMWVHTNDQGKTLKDMVQNYKQGQDPLYWLYCAVVDASTPLTRITNKQGKEEYLTLEEYQIRCLSDRMRTIEKQEKQQLILDTIIFGLNNADQRCAKIIELINKMEKEKVCTKEFRNNQRELEIQLEEEQKSICGECKSELEAAMLLEKFATHKKDYAKESLLLNAHMKQATVCKHRQNNIQFLNDSLGSILIKASGSSATLESLVKQKELYSNLEIQALGSDFVWHYYSQTLQEYQDHECWDDSIGNFIGKLSDKLKNDDNNKVTISQLIAEAKQVEVQLIQLHKSMVMTQRLNKKESSTEMPWLSRISSYSYPLLKLYQKDGHWKSDLNTTISNLIHDYDAKHAQLEHKNSIIQISDENIRNNIKACLDVRDGTDTLELFHSLSNNVIDIEVQYEKLDVASTKACELKEKIDKMNSLLQALPKIEAHMKRILEGDSKWKLLFDTLKKWDQLDNNLSLLIQSLNNQLQDPNLLRTKEEAQQLEKEANKIAIFLRECEQIQSQSINLENGKAQALSLEKKWAPLFTTALGL